MLAVTRPPVAKQGVNHRAHEAPKGHCPADRIEPTADMSAETFAQSLIGRAHNFASYAVDYSAPKHLGGDNLRAGEYNSSSYLAGLLTSVMGCAPVLVCPGYQTPGWENRLPSSLYKGEALR